MQGSNRKARENKQETCDFRKGILNLYHVYCFDHIQLLQPFSLAFKRGARVRD